MNLGPTELIIVLVIVVVLFGVGRLSKIGSELGTGIREFKKGLSDDEAPKDELPAALTAPPGEKK
jgi:sec-independent protein translocase protein TatA